MRVRGRRVALLLAGALQLLADEAETTGGIAETRNAEIISNEKDGSDNNDGGDDAAADDDDGVVVPLSAVEAIHDDGFQIPSLPKADIILPDETTLQSSTTTTTTTTTKTAEENSLHIDENIDTNGEQDENIIGTEAQKNQRSNEESNDLDKQDSLQEESLQNHERTEEYSEDGSIADSDEHDNANAHNPQNDMASTTTTAATTTTKGTSDSMDDSSSESNQTDGDEKTGTLSQNETLVEEEEEEEMVIGESPEDEKSSAEDDDVEKEKEEEKPDDGDDDEDEEGTIQNRVSSVDYASKSAGALIIEKSKGFKGTSNLLNGDKDKYAIAPCDDKKFVIISLSEEILVKTIKIANYERFSSTVNEFQVLGSQTLGTWVDLGTYSASPGNGEQIFDLIEPSWARYLNFKFLSHHGVEYYCTCSQIQVHGSTMAQGFHEHWEEENKEEESEPDVDDVHGSNIEVEGKTDTTTTGSAATDDDNTAEHHQTDSSDDKVYAGDAENVEKISTSSGQEDKSAQHESERTKDSLESIEDPHDKETAGGGTHPWTQDVTVGQFRPSENLDAMLHGRIEDGVLLTELFDLIPSTLMTLPSASRKSPGRKTSNDEGELQSFHTFLQGSATFKSTSSSFVTSDWLGDSEESHTSGTIIAPKMSDAVDEMVRFGRDLATRISNLHTLGAESSHHTTNDPSMLPAEKQPPDDDEESDNNAAGTSNSDETKEISKEEDISPAVSVQSDNQENESQGDQVVPTNASSHGATETADPSSNQNSHTETTTTTIDQPSSSSNTVDAVDDNSVILTAIQAELPSADCLRNLNFTEMKAKAMASRKSASGGGSSQSNTAPMEPIFKKLTDEIRSLQTSLSVHEQYSKSLTACYERVLLDLIAESERKLSVQDERLSRLEEEFKRSQSFFLLRIVRWLLQCASSAVVYSYHGLYYSYSYLTLTMQRFRVADILRLRIWPNIKKALFSWKSGAALVESLSPLILRMDQLLDSLEYNRTAQEDDSFFDESLVGQVADWAVFHIVPLLIALVVFRVLMMCYTTSNDKRLREVRKSTIVANEKSSSSASSQEHGVPELGNENLSAGKARTKKGKKKSNMK